MPPVRLSVIVTCTQPWPDVRGCLKRLVPQARSGGVEIIVADGSDGGLDATAAVQVTWLRAPGRGPHELRYLGLVEARGDVVAITEDHCDVAPDWCGRVLDAHARCPETVAIAGPVTNGAASRLMDRASFFLVHAHNVPGRGTRPDGWFPPSGSNASYKREQVLPMLERAGDLELVVVPQLWAEGRLVLDETVVVAHSQSMGAAEHVVNHFHAARSHAGLVAERGMPMGRRALVRDAVTFPGRLLGATLDVGREVPKYRRDIRRAVPAMTVLALAATAGYLAGIAGPGRSLRRLH
jgi:Glycosyl transferase family 2